MPGVYISYPFCQQKCTYCNFASGVFPAGLEAAYTEALLAEIRAFNFGWTPETVYIGGGTPSQATGDVIQAILSAVPGRPWKEATLEVAPGTITSEKVAAWRAAGIDRVSLGVQSFDTGELRRTGRKHTADVVSSDIALLRGGGIENFNVDLIAGLAGQTRDSWERSLDWIERLQPPHVSIYMLEVDEDSRLGRELIAGGVRYGAADVPSEEAITSFYEAAVERLKGLGIQRYEISNFAQHGFESLHNLKYWRREPYAGFGADAHSFDGRMRYANAPSAVEYVNRQQAGQPVRLESEPAKDDERLFLGLRLDEGVRLLATDWDRHSGTIRELVAGGLLRHDGERVSLTARGVLVSNEVFQEFLQ